MTSYRNLTAYQATFSTLDRLDRHARFGNCRAFGQWFALKINKICVDEFSTIEEKFSGGKNVTIPHVKSLGDLWLARISAKSDLARQIADNMAKMAQVPDPSRPSYIGKVGNPLQAMQTHNERGIYSSPVSSHSMDFPNSLLIESKTSAPASFRPSSIADR
jgi:hypothetical protein